MNLKRGISHSLAYDEYEYTPYIGHMPCILESLHLTEHYGSSQTEGPTITYSGWRSTVHIFWVWDLEFAIMPHAQSLSFMIVHTPSSCFSMGVFVVQMSHNGLISLKGTFLSQSCLQSTVTSQTSCIFYINIVLALVIPTDVKVLKGRYEPHLELDRILLVEIMCMQWSLSVHVHLLTML